MAYQETLRGRKKAIQFDDPLGIRINTNLIGKLGKRSRLTGGISYKNMSFKSNDATSDIQRFKAQGLDFSFGIRHYLQ